MSELDNIGLRSVEAGGTRSYLFYGPAGSGKTTLAAMHPGKRKLWLDVDQKLHEMEVLPNRESIKVWAPLGATRQSREDRDPVEPGSQERAGWHHSREEAPGLREARDRHE